MNKLLQLVFMLLCVLPVGLVYGEKGADPVLSEVDEPVLPKRGYLDLVPFFATENELVSIQLPTIENPPTALLSMPVVSDLGADWPHTDDGDVVYDVTKWFPLDKMRSKGGGDDERWVYYNQSSGYFIANADHFLRCSLYDYVKGRLSEHPTIYRVSLIYLELDDDVPLSVEAIGRSQHDVLMRYSGVSGSGERFSAFGDLRTFSIEMCRRSDELCAFNMVHYEEERYQFESNFYLKVGKWAVHECGISSANRRRVLVVRCEYENLLGQVVHFPMAKDQFVGVPYGERNADPFGEDEYPVIYDVPVDVVDLLSPNEDSDPFGDGIESKDPGGDVVDLAKLLLLQGVQAKAVFHRPSSTIVAYTDESGHSMLEELFMQLGPRSYFSSVMKVGFYEMDGSIDSGGHALRVEDLLSRRPVKLASLGGVTLSGSVTTLARGGSSCKIELSRDEYDYGVDLSFKLSMGLPGLKVDGAKKMYVKYDVPKIVRLARGDGGRVVVMMVRVSRM